MNFWIISKPDCKYCSRLKRWFKRWGIDYRESNVLEDLDAKKVMGKNKLKMLPVLVIDDEVVSHEPYENIIDHIKNNIPTKVVKRDESIVEYEHNKIIKAIRNANEETNELNDHNVLDVSDAIVIDILNTEKDKIHVEDIQDIAEKKLMEQGFYDTAKAYILYREKQANMRKRDIFKPRVNLKPYEYPELEKYKEAIQHSYWLFSEYNYTSDVQDYKVNVKPHERTAIKNAMLAISQVEVDVKTFWGDLYKRMPKPELANVGATFSESECYREGTEILTPEGFKDFRDVDNGDIVAQFNHDNTIEWVPAKNKIVKDIDGKLHHLTKSYMDVWITPEHNMVIYKNKDNDHFDLIPSSEVNGRNSGWFIPQSGRLKNINAQSHLTDMEKLYIAIQADGNFRFWTNKNGERVPRGASSGKQTYEITFKKERKISRLLKLLESLDIDYSEYNISRDGYRKFSIDLDNEYNYKTFDWVDLQNKNSEWCEEFIQELADWDGCRIKGKKDGNISYSTTNEEVANMVQSIAILAGYRVTVSKYEDKRKDTYNDCYKMVFVENRERVTGTYNKEEVDYKGKVYCVEVPSGAIITRYGGKMFIGGNCRHADAYSNLLELLGLNKEFEKIDEIPALKQRIQYLKRHIDYANTGNDRDYVTAVLLFSSAIEHISLFSQFLIIMSFNKEKNLFSGISNAIEATSKEEQLHGEFGIDLVNTVKEERPEWFDETLANDVYAVFKEAYESEKELLDWIFEDGELDFLPKSTVLEFIKNRMNNSLEAVGLDRMFEVDIEEVEKTDWFTEEVVATKHVDFFAKRSVNYTKRSRSITQDDLF